MRGGQIRVALLLGALLALGAVALARAETIQRQGLRIHVDGQITPKRLPRTGLAPVKVTVGTKITSTSAKRPPALKKIVIAINRFGRLDPTGLPVCEVSDIQPSTNEKALQACRGSLVGEGHFAATVAVSKQVSFPSDGKMLAFNGTYEGQPAILAHVYGTAPVPTSFTLPFVIARTRGTFGTTLTATLPAAEGNFVTGIDLSLGRSFTYRGKRRSYASATCPAPRGLPGALFSFARVSYAFAGGAKLQATLTRNCRAGG
jgi:hypothetical protein